MLFARDIDEPFELQFKVYSSDVDFFNYTQCPSANEQAIVYYQQLVSGKEEQNEVIQASVLKEQCSISNSDHLNPPCFIVNMSITPELIRNFANAGFLAPTFLIKLQSQENIWKYYLMSSKHDSELAIVDLAGKVTFEAMGLENLAANKQAVTFQSHTALSLCEKSNYHFQLTSTEERFSKVLIKRLPVATVNQRYQTVIDGNAVSLSEIYINF